MDIATFTYALPNELIAYEPLANRDDSRLLVYKNAQIEHKKFKQIVEVVPPDSLMIFNNSRVIQVRLQFYKSSGAAIEIFCLEPKDKKDIQLQLQAKGKVLWNCLVGNAKRWKEEVLQLHFLIENKSYTLFAQKLAQNYDTYEIEFSWNNTELSFAEVLHGCGKIPLPPYIKREANSSDTIRYQTTYAKPEGSVAAPTAGLHFTDNILDELKSNAVQKEFLTLHVGAGTFMPVKTQNIKEHQMHEEFFQVDKRSLEHFCKYKKASRIAVGTTSLRSLESLYWLGVKAHLNADYSFLTQWEAYSLPTTLSFEESLKVLIKKLDINQQEVLQASTALMIVPGYRFRSVQSLITNFHQSGSTLLALVAAFIGEDWKRIYIESIAEKYRFLSYGDSSILFQNET
jgi:S-adenosylmethionine:tRNA ribosyltransferase-isomerase